MPGVSAVRFLAAISAEADLPKTVREIAILTVGAAFTYATNSMPTKSWDVATYEYA